MFLHINLSKITMTQSAFTNADNIANWLNEDAKGLATRTVYMDSNIALTNGAGKLGDNGVKTIPNLYNAISDMDARIEKINTTHGPSTADAGLFVTSGDGEITMSPLTFSTDSMQNANSCIPAGSKGIDGLVFRISAPNIEFEVTGSEITVTGYFVNFTGETIPDTIQTVNGITLSKDETYALVPVEGSTITGADDGNTVADSLLCNLFKYDTTNNKYILAVSHMKVTSAMELKYTKKDDAISAEITVPSVKRYNLGAIIEAIQELNRRTMFMDTDMSFQSGVEYNDTHENTVPGALHTKTDDGLPAAVNGSVESA